LATPDSLVTVAPRPVLWFMIRWSGLVVEPT
jgi:hypothetical protein